MRLIARRRALISRSFARMTMRASTLSRVQSPCLKLPLRPPRGPPEPLAPPCIRHLSRPRTAGCRQGRPARVLAPQRAALAKLASRRAMSPDAWGRPSFLPVPRALSGIHDADYPLGPGVEADVSNLDRLLVAAPMPVKGLDEVKLKPQQLMGGGAISVDVGLHHVLLALAQKAKSREPCCDNLHRYQRFQFRPTVG